MLQYDGDSSLRARTEDPRPRPLRSRSGFSAARDYGYQCPVYLQPPQQVTNQPFTIDDNLYFWQSDCVELKEALDYYNIFLVNRKMNPKVVMMLAKQVQECQKNTPDGIKLIINEADITDIQAEIEGPKGTPYEGGFFRCKLAVQNDFPTNPPKGYFITKIFHPNVSEKGQICVNTLKKDWNPAAWSLSNILEVVKCLLIVPFPESALNEQAGKMFMENYDEYFKYAKMITSLYAAPKQLKALENVGVGRAQNSSKKNIEAMQEEKPEPVTVPVKKENDNKKKWMKRI